MKSKQKNQRADLFVLAECSIMIALSTVLSIFKIFEMPYGGSITIASMLPIALVAYRHGAKIGLGTAFTAAIMQMLLGLKNFSYFTTLTSFIALAVFDYLLAFGIFGLAGIFRRHIKEQNLSLALGVLFATVIRYVFHVISGATVWAGLSIPTEAALVYSISYNATYMIPECIIHTLVAIYLGSALDFTKRIPTRKINEKLDTVSVYLYAGSGLAALAGLIADTVLVFSKLQDPSGEFVITNIVAVNFTAIAIISVAAVAVAIVLSLIAHRRTHTK